MIYLRLIGYENSHGVDIVDRPENNDFLRQFGITEKVFFKYNGKRLPFETGQFDVVISNGVLEHVQGIEDYYREASRVLKKGGYAFCQFPDRLVPFDTHSRTWFVHYFPKRVRKYLYDVFTEKGSSFYEDYLNLRSRYYHRKLARKYFPSWKDTTKERLSNFHYRHYHLHGNVNLRQLADKVMNTKVVGPAFLSLFSMIAIVDMELRK